MPGRAATLLMSRGAPDQIHLQSDQGLGHPGPAAGEHGPGAQEPQGLGAERELVEPRPGAPEVIVVHERIASPAARVLHEQGWLGCLAGLAEFLDEPGS